MDNHWINRHRAHPPKVFRWGRLFEGDDYGKFSWVECDPDELEVSSVAIPLTKTTAVQVEFDRWKIETTFGDED